MSWLATLLSRFELHAPVVDKAGLRGVYAVKLEWSDSAGTDADRTGPTVFTAVQEQLGLKLEARKGPVEVLVVDHAERTPLDN